MNGEEQRKILDELGFEAAGSWALDNGRPAPELASGRSSGEALYAFVSDGEVVYIGRAREAFGGQIGGGDEPLGLVRRFTTDNDRRIIETLMGFRTIEILAMEPTEAVTYRGWRLNVAAGLKEALVRKIQPAWITGGGRGSQRSQRPF